MKVNSVNSFNCKRSNSVNSFNCKRSNSFNFKSVYPVRIWVSDDTSAKSHLTKNEEENRHVLRRLIRRMNGSLKTGIDKNKEIIEKVYKFISKIDKDYENCKNKKKVISFETSRNGIPYCYLITGKDDIKAFEAKCKLDLIDSKRKAKLEENKELKNKCLEEGKRKYHKAAEKFVEEKSKEFVNKKGQQLALHVLVDPIFNKKSEIKDYKIADMKYSYVLD